jgi:hypothetical protein
MPGKPDVGGTDFVGLAYLVIVLAVIFLPILLGGPPPPPGSSDNGGDDGPGPPDPPLRPCGPPDGIPLPDAQPARRRFRDHGRLADGFTRRPRRPVTLPGRRRRVRI